MVPGHLRRLRIVVYALLAVFALLLVASLPSRCMHGDDAWLGEQAYWMSKCGFVRSELFRGLLDYDQRQMVYHKLFILTGAAVVRIFGWSLYNLKAVSLACFLAFLTFFYLYFRRRQDLFGSWDFWIATLFMVSAPLVFRYCYVFRPEIMLMTLGFLSFCFLTSPEGGASARRAAAAGAFAGLGVLAHLNGWIFVAAGLAVLVRDRRLRPTLAFVLAAAAVSLLYFYDLTSVAALRLYRFQLANDLPIGNTGPLGRLVNILYEPKRFFYSAREISASTLLVLALGFSWRIIWTRHRDVLVYLAVLVIGLPLLSRPRPSYYIVLYMPYIAVIVAVAFRHLGSLGRIRSAVLVGVAALHLAYCLYHSVEVILARQDLPGINREIAGYLEAGSSVAAPSDFIFNQIGNYRIQSLTLYNRCAERAGTKLDPASFFALARDFGNDYVVVDEEFEGQIGLRSAGAVGAVGGYAPAGQVRDRTIYRLRATVAPDRRPGQKR
jgi:hypothetical protein